MVGLSRQMEKIRGNYKLVICEKMNTVPSESSNKINSLPFFGSLTPHESTRVDNGLGMLIGGLLAGGASGMLTHAREEYQHKQMYGHMNTIEQTASKSKLLHLVSRNGLKYGGFVAAFIGCELSIARARGKEDYWNVCAAGAVTGGAFCARGGPAAVYRRRVPRGGDAGPAAGRARHDAAAAARAAFGAGLHNHLHSPRVPTQGHESNSE